MLVINKYVFISLSNRAGGAEQCLEMLAKASSSKHIFVQQSDTNTLVKDLNNHQQFITKGPLSWGGLLLLKRLFEFRKGYIIISSAVYLNSFLGFLKQIRFIKSEIVVRESTSVFDRFTGLKRLSYSLSYRLGYKAVNMVICQTESMRNQFLKYNTFLDPQKVIMLENPVDLDDIHKRLLQESNVPQYDFICAAGRLIPLKGFNLLIDAFKLISSQNLTIKLIILGEGPARDSLTKQIEQLCLNDRVLLVGHVVNPFPYFKRARVCVVSSLREGFPNVLLQMMAVNTSIVTTLCAGAINDLPVVLKVETQKVLALKQGIENRLNCSCQSRRPELDEYLKSRSPSQYLDSLAANLMLL